MVLKRKWYPTGSYSNGGKKRLIVIHTMEGFTGPYGAQDCAIYFQGDVGASSQVCIDNNRGTIWEGVSRYNGSWTQCYYNSESVSAEQSGYASWSKDYWLSNRDAQLHNMADYIAEESKALGIPIVLLSDSQAQGGSAGVTFHSRLGSSGCGHSDPGSGFPINEVLAWAKGGTSTSSAGGTGSMAAICTWVNPDTGEETIHEAAIWTDGRVCYSGPGTNGLQSVDDHSNAKSLGGIVATKPGKKIISYTNQGNELCWYVQEPGEWEWTWVKKGGSIK